MFSFTLIDHTSWYEVVFDIVVFAIGLTLGALAGLFLLLHHINAGFTYLHRVSSQRGIADDDLWIAFSWAGRRIRRDAMRNYETTLKPPRAEPRQLRVVSHHHERADDDPKAGRAG